jgi:hypothetical protein
MPQRCRSHHNRRARKSTSTVNKQLGAVQTIGLWARDNGIVPDDVPCAATSAVAKVVYPDIDLSGLRPAKRTTRAPLAHGEIELEG